jgi:catalase
LRSPEFWGACTVLTSGAALVSLFGPHVPCWALFLICAAAGWTTSRLASFALRIFPARAVGAAFGAGLFIVGCFPGRSKWIAIGALAVIAVRLLLRLKRTTWADLLRRPWVRVIVLVAAAGGAVVSLIMLPCWSSAIVVAGTAWLVTTVAYLSVPVFSARIIGMSTFGGLVIFGCAPGWLRWIGVGGAAAILVLLWLRISGVRKADVVATDRTELPVLSDDGNRLVDAIDAIWGSTREHGPRCGLRAVHSHGSVVQGTWRATGVDRLNKDVRSTVGLFTANRKGRVVARFSNFGGQRERDDARRGPHGLALRLEGEGGDHESMDLVMVDIDRFPTATREDFVSFTRAFALRGFRRLHAMAWLILTGRTTVLAQWALINTRTTSYTVRTYQGLNTFYWQGVCRHDDHPPTGCPNQGRVPVRYVARPVEQHRTPSRAGRSAQAFLDHDLRARLADGSVRFAIELEIGTTWKGRWFSKQRLHNSMSPWPQGRRPTVCTVELTTYCGEEDPGHGFDPLHVPPGVEPSDDEILRARAAAYPTSYLRRWPRVPEEATVGR